jgi:hypothetical protein
MVRTCWAVLLAVVLSAGASGCCCTGSGGCFDAIFACNGCYDPAPCGGCGSVGACGCGAGPIVSARNAASCGSGCGSVYWDEWCSDPPDCCDPCDHGGNWTGGGGCCGPSGLLCCLSSLWGRRYVAGDCCEGCGPGTAHHHAPSQHYGHPGQFGPGGEEGTVIYDGPAASAPGRRMAPTPSPQPQPQPNAGLRSAIKQQAPISANANRPYNNQQTPPRHNPYPHQQTTGLRPVR